MWFFFEKTKKTFRREMMNSNARGKWDLVPFITVAYGIYKICEFSVNYFIRKESTNNKKRFHWLFIRFINLCLHTELYTITSRLLEAVAGDQASLRIQWPGLIGRFRSVYSWRLKVLSIEMKPKERIVFKTA